MKCLSIYADIIMPSQYPSNFYKETSFHNSVKSQRIKSSLFLVLYCTSLHTLHFSVHTSLYTSHFFSHFTLHFSHFTPQFTLHSLHFYTSHFFFTLLFTLHFSHFTHHFTHFTFHSFNALYYN